MKIKKILAILLAIAMLAAFAAACGSDSADTGSSSGDAGNDTSSGSGTDTGTDSGSDSGSAGNDSTGSDDPVDTPPAEIVTIRTIYPGEPPQRFDAVLAAINEKMGRDIGVNLDISWSPWSDYYTKVQLDISAGLDIDYFWEGSPAMPALHASRLLAPIDDLMQQFGQDIYASVDAKFFDSMKIDGVLMGFPSTANSPISAVNHSLTVREDLRLKYNLPPVDTLANLELFLQTIADNEPGIYPIMANNIGFTILPWFGDEMFLGGTGGGAGMKINADGSITVMPIQDAPAWRAATEKVREWYEKGWVPADILNLDPNGMFMMGMGAVSSGSALYASERQAEISMNVPGAVIVDQPVRGSGTLWLAGNGGNAMYLASTSSKGEAVVKFWNWVHASRENYDLYCYGVEGVDFELNAQGRVVLLSDYPALFPHWMFKNSDFLRFNEAVTDEYIEVIRTWDDGSVLSPLFGFAFNSENVSAEVGAVWATAGAFNPSLQSGAADFNTILPEFISQMEASGQLEVVEEAQRQVDDWLAG